MAVVGAFAVPHPPLAVAGVGKGREHEIQNTLDALAEVGRRAAALEPDVVVISSPHATAYYDYVHIAPGAGASGDFAGFGDPADEIEVAYDPELAAAISQEALLAGVLAGKEGARDESLDHGTMVPLSFLQAQGVRCPVVRMGLSGFSPLDHYRLGQAVARACDRLGRRAVVVGSGDLSHKLLESGPYGYDPAGPVFDRLMCEALESGDFAALLDIDTALTERAAQCGLKSFLIMAGALDGRTVRPELLSYEGPFGVGYAVAAFAPGGPDPRRRFGEEREQQELEAIDAIRHAEDPWVRLARQALESHVRAGKVPSLPQDLPPELTGTRAGAFCSIKKDGELRGCIGTTAPTQASLALEIQQNAVSAGTRDPRFPEVTPDELDRLVYSVDVLAEPEAVAGLEDLDPARYGVIVSSADGRRRGLLLPALDGVTSAEQQVAIARRKGGIGEDEPVSLRRFEVVRHR